MKTLLICMLVFLFAGLAGCNTPSGGVIVIIEDSGHISDSLAGTWQSDKYGWEFVFEPDGTISSAVVPLGNVRVEPGKITKVPMKLDGEGTYKPGEWVVVYSPPQRMLTVTITLDRIHLELGKGLLKGSSRDVFTGQLSEDGETWFAEWTSFTNYTAHTAEFQDFDLSSDPIYGNYASLVFTKQQRQQN